MTDVPSGMPDLSSLLGKIMENPSALSMLTDALGGAIKGPSEKRVEAAPGENDSVAALARPAPSAAKDPRQEDRRRLLCALKPFLSPERGEALDRILKASELLSLLKGAQLFR